MTTRRLALLLLAMSLGAGCVAPGTDYEALPFYREDRTTPDVVRAEVPLLLVTVDSLSPDPAAVGSGTELQDESHRGEASVVRAPWPFGLWVSDGRHHSFVLTGFLGGEGVGTAPGPMGRALSTDGEVRSDLLSNFASDPTAGGVGTLPFVFYDTLTDHEEFPDVPGEDRDRDTGLLPLFAWGNGDDRDDDDGDDDYLVVAPFGGTTRGIIGKDQITWIGFPYPLYAHVQDRAYTSHHVLFPLVNWLEGPGLPNDYAESDRDPGATSPPDAPMIEGFRIFPFYGHYERRSLRGDPIYDRTWLMWPLLTWHEDGLNEPLGPTETFMAFPFYGHIDGPERDVYTVLFPFFKYTDERRPGVESWELRAPFPFLQVGGAEDGSWRFDLWPLMGLKSRPNYDRQFFLWPIIRHESLDLPRATFDGFWLLPFFWRTAWRDKVETDEPGIPQREHPGEEVRTRVFPFAHHRALRDGTVDFALLSPWWKDDDGFERTLGSLLRLYRFHRDATGGVEHQALLGLVSWRDLPAIPGRAEYSRLSLLWGMVQARSLGGEAGLRLLWLLPELTWGEVGP